MTQCTSDLLPLDDLIRLSESDRYVEDSKFADLVDLEILEHYKEAARKGNVRPYVRFQWSFASLDGFQWDILESLFNPEIAEVFVKGNTGCGKGASAGIACCMYFDLYENAKIVVTRNNAEDAKQVAYGEVVKWWDEMRIKPNGIPQASRIIEKGRSKHHYLKIANPQHKEGFRGVHSENVLFYLDEATSANLEDKFSLARTQAKKILALSNPSTIAGEFRSAFPANDRDTTQTISTIYGKRRCITISGWDCSNVMERRLSKPSGPIGGIEIKGRKFEHSELIPEEYYEHVKPRIPGQTCYNEFMALLNSPDPFMRNVMALGKFPDEDPEKQVILPSYLVRPNELWLKWQRAWNKWRERHNARALKMLERLLPVQAFGLDVAASATGDKTQLAAGGERGCRELHECQFQDTTQTVDWILETTRELYGIDLTRGGIPIAIDWGGGYGNAVGDPLRRKGVKVVQVNLGSAAELNPKRYGNKRAELYGEFARRVDPLGDFAESSFYLPDDRELAEELVAPQKIPQGQDGQKFILTPKTRSGASENFKGKTIKELLGRSPDKADAVVLLHEAVRHVGMSLSKTLENGFW